MKNVFAILLMSVAAQSAFAMHAYGEDSCVARMINGTELRITIANGEPANPHKLSPLDGSATEEIETVEFQGAKVGGNEQGSNLVLKIKSEANIIKKNESDGCFEGYSQTSTRVATVEKVNSEIAKTFGLKKAMSVNFVCFTSASAPVGKHCN